MNGKSTCQPKQMCEVKNAKIEWRDSNSPYIDLGTGKEISGLNSKYDKSKVTGGHNAYSNMS